MAPPGGIATKKASASSSSQSDHHHQLLLGFAGPSSWFGTIVAICCICSLLYVLQSLLVDGGRGCAMQATATALSQLPSNDRPPTQPHSSDKNSSSAAAALLVPQLDDPPPPPPARNATTGLTRIVFGIAAAAKNWPNRKHYIKQWWKPTDNNNTTLRGFIWLDQAVNTDDAADLPPFKISGDTSRFQYKYRGGRRSAIRISRVVSEMFRLGLPDVDWFVMGDDDSFFFPQNLALVLSKYDAAQMHYLGSNSECHVQNIIFSYNMAFGGGGFAISFPLARELAKMQDACLVRYPQLFGSDDRMQACMSEIGVPLTKELGFHQMDIQGDASGLLAAHPLAPLVSLHHLDAIHPIFPRRTRPGALAHLLEAAKIESVSLLQQSICYYAQDAHGGEIGWSISISWGYAVHVYKGFLTPRELETPLRTFASLRRRTDPAEFAINTREPAKDICQRPSLYFMESVRGARGLLESVYVKDDDAKRSRACDASLRPLSSVQLIRVSKEPVEDTWFQAPRRSCCRVKAWRTDTIEMHVGACRAGEGVVTSSASAH